MGTTHFSSVEVGIDYKLLGQDGQNYDLIIVTDITPATPPFIELHRIKLLMRGGIIISVESMPKKKVKIN